MDDWRKQLVKYENANEFDTAVNYMQYVIEIKPECLDVWLTFNYLLMNYLVEGEHGKFGVDYYSKLLRKYFHMSYEKYSNIPDYLFYTAITAYMSEWYMDLSVEDVDDMLEKALKMDVNNTLYLWGYYTYVSNDKASEYKSKSCACEILNDNVNKQLIRSKGSLGVYILEIMDYQTKSV